MSSYNDQKSFELITNYLKGNLDQEEYSKFERRMVDNKELQEEVNRLKKEILLVEEYGLREQLKSIHEELYPKKKIQNLRPLILITGIAASLAAIIVLFFLPYETKLTEKTNSELFRSYFHPYQNVVSSRGNSTYKDFIDAYSQERFDDAILIGESLSSNDTITFYLAISYMSIDEFYLAKQALTKVQKSSRFFEQATWYKSLLLLWMSSTDSSKYYLNSITENEFKYEEAQELLDLLK